MSTSRRKFISTALQASALLAASAYAPLVSAEPNYNTQEKFPSLINLHKIFKEPVKIRNIEILRVHKKLFVRVTSEDNITGITQCNQRMEYLIPIFKGLVVPFFTGKDARDIEHLVDIVYKDGRNYKYAGMPFSNCVGHLELSIWDLLGRTAKQPAARFFGSVIRHGVPVYLSSLTRDNSAEEEIEWLGGQLKKTGAKAIKVKVGGRMTSKEKVPGRSKRIIALARKTFGSDLTIYADANGSYTAEEGIEVGRMLQDNGVAIFEEPCAWEDNTSNKKVADSLSKIVIAGGEQDTSLYRFQHIIDNRTYDLVQPDLYYNGGLLRCLQVAKMAAKAGLGIAPHSPKADPMEAAMLQFAAVVPNLYGFQEYPAKAGAQPEWYSPHFLITDGSLAIPTGDGLGVTYDESIWKKEVIL